MEYYRDNTQDNGQVSIKIIMAKMNTKLTMRGPSAEYHTSWMPMVVPVKSTQT